LQPAGSASPQKADLAGEPNHINGVFAADIMRFRRVFAGRARNSRETARNLRCLPDVFA
jgi:hypothetical protein